MIMHGTRGLWYFPCPPPRTPRTPKPDKALESRSRRDELRRAGYAASAAVVSQLQHSGAEQQVVFEQQATTALARRLDAQSNRCLSCWHDRVQRCICASVQPLSLALPVRVLVLMHHKEYLRASDDAKLLLMMLPPDRARLFIFGRPGDLEALQSELDEDSGHSMVLWPGDGALTVAQWQRGAAPHGSPWQRMGKHIDKGAVSNAASNAACDAEAGAAHRAPPLLRVVVLDAVYRAARMMFRHLRKMREHRPLPAVALHPTTLSVYSRAQHGYAQASAATTSQSGDPEALRICTVEAYALLLEELGEPAATTQALVEAVIINNRALSLGASSK